MSDRHGTEQSHGQPLPRRRFIDWLLGTTFGGLIVAVCYPVVRYLIPPPAGESAVNSVTLTIKPSDLAPNSGQIFKFGDEPGIILRTPGGEIRAFTAVCTHLGCIVKYEDGKQDLWCPCHNGRYNLNGVNVSGPPPKPLTQYTVNVRGDQIVVNKGA